MIQLGGKRKKIPLALFWIFVFCSMICIFFLKKKKKKKSKVGVVTVDG